MKKIHILLLATLLLTALVGAIYLYTQNNNELTKPTDSTEVATTTTTEVPSIPKDIADHIKEKSDLIVLESLLPYTKISSPVVLKGKARGYWFFEASFPVTVVNWDGLIIGEGIATADGEWMTENFVPFTATIDFTYASTTPYNRGSIILKKDNPSGLPENDDALEIPIVFEN